MNFKKLLSISAMLLVVIMASCEKDFANNVSPIKASAVQVVNKSDNAFISKYQVAGAVTLGTTSHFEGTILCQTAINLLTGASINGRMLAQTAVTLQKNTVNLAK
jgi:hypothetical protein